MITVYIDPWSDKFLKDRLFDPSESCDNVLLRWSYLREACFEQSVILRTIDRIDEIRDNPDTKLCYSIGSLNGYRNFKNEKDVCLCSIYLFEPPIGIAPVRKDLYRCLPELTNNFKRVYTTSPISDIGKVYNMNVSGLSTLHFDYPQSYSYIIESLWNNTDRKHLVMINSYNYSPIRDFELYSDRMKLAAYFASRNSLDLFGYRWNTPLFESNYVLVKAIAKALLKRDISRLEEYMAIMTSKRHIISSLKGRCNNQLHSTLSKYDFSIRFESMRLPGFITEKIFDCFNVGTIPIYDGAPDIKDFIPSDCFIDRRDFSSNASLYRFLNSLSGRQKKEYRESGRAFMQSKAFTPFSKEYFAKRFVEDVKKDLKSIGRI